MIFNRCVEQKKVTFNLKNFGRKKDQTGSGSPKKSKVNKEQFAKISIKND